MNLDLRNAYINVKPEGGGGGGGIPGMCGAFDFSEEFVIKIPIVGPQNLVKSDQISPTFQHLIFWQKASWSVINNPHNPNKVRCSIN